LKLIHREKIKQMRDAGFSYSRIAAAMGISENTVKSFCRRNNLNGFGVKASCNGQSDCCRQCGRSLVHITGAKQKRFCSDKCRMIWWNSHPEAVNRKAIFLFNCIQCGASVESYGNKKRKYCSRACYGKSKAVRHV
jgi:endogenous inhibitor of DNA gyrase (YacG/DUF329 family)